MNTYIRPPLKWAGGKYRLLDRIISALPSGKRLVEPFVGSGAVFLNADYPSFLLCDLNEDLINFFRWLSAEKYAFIARSKEYFSPDFNCQGKFYELRERFNSIPYGEERAAVFLYLNRHGFNGLVRYNSKGEFNTPFGRYASPYFPHKEMGAVADKATRCELEFVVKDFREIFSSLHPGDVIYCDPPYVTLSDTANFTSYTSSQFSHKDQEDLSECASAASRKGHTVVLSNHDTPFSRGIYRDAACVSFPVQRFISCDGKNRGKAQELLAVFS